MKIYDPRYYGKLNSSVFSLNGGFIGIDLESSGISKNAFPIEVGWYGSGLEGSILIKPTKDWLSNGFWCEFAEKNLHGISKVLLNQKGLEVKLAALKLNETLKDKVVVSDIVEFDGIWLTQLYEQADINPSFRLIGYQDQNEFRKRTGGYFPKVLKSSEERSHRALDDAKWLYNKNKG